MLQDGGWDCQPVAVCALPGHRPLCGLRDMRWLHLVVHMGSCTFSSPICKQSHQYTACAWLDCDMYMARRNLMCTAFPACFYACLQEDNAALQNRLLMQSELLCVTALQDREEMSNPQSLQSIYHGTDHARWL